MTLAEDGHYDVAAEEARRLIARVPADAVAHTLLGIAYEALDNLPAARQAFAAALAIDANEATARREIVKIDGRLSQRP